VSAQKHNWKVLLLEEKVPKADEVKRRDEGRGSRDEGEQG